MKNKEYSELEIKLATQDVMLVSLYNTIVDMVHSISPKTKVADFKEWVESCEKSAIKILEKEKESENNGN